MPSRLAPGLVVLYHRISDPSSDPLGLCVGPERFAEHLRSLAALAPIVPLGDVGRSRIPTIAVTFDDGYADNLDAAAPILEEASLPGTVFVASELLDDEGEFWWDRLEHLLLDGESAVPNLDVTIAGRHLRVDVRTGQGRARALRALNRRLRVLPRPTILRVLEEVADQTGRTAAGACRAHRRITRDDLVHAVGRGSVRVGAHTVSHTMLSALDEDGQRDEIVRGRTDLEASFGPVEDFAYPYGTIDSLTPLTTRLVADAGFQRAYVNIPGVVGPRSDRWRLPRLMIHDWEAGELRAHVAPMLDR